MSEDKKSPADREEEPVVSEASSVSLVKDEHQDDDK